ncbi:LysR family transcriptional regulator [Luteolibacter marinus]|uniref:LysR family transcriptional regulator n=1 Tax=Luteolibacter marinus TaxID=2776705 RepID=UPI0018667088|nr:LysR substrate-binding domain-containing protein [Luteolibacter marinus]
MELRHLRYFVAVAEELNFRKAAERLNVTRPALSKQIKDLEEDTGVKLLNRDTVSVSLTDAGSVFLRGARQILDQVQQTIRLAREAQDGRQGELRIGSVGQIAAGFLPEALKAFGAEFPGVEVLFVEMTPAEQLKALAEGRIHLGFAYGREVDQSPGLASLRLVTSIFGVSVSKEHPFASRSSLSLRDLGSQSLLCLGEENSSAHRRSIERIFEEEGVKQAAMRKISGFEALLTMIAADQGVSLLPEVLDLRKSHGITTIPLDLEKAQPDFTMWAVWKNNDPSPLVRNFARILRTNRGHPGSAPD